MSIEDITRVVNTWCNEMHDLGQKYDWVQIFENKGAIMVRLIILFYMTATKVFYNLNVLIIRFL